TFGLCRTGIVRHRDVRHFDLWRHLRDADYVAGSASASVAAFLLLWTYVGCTWASDHSEDRRPVSGPATRHHSGGHHHWHRHRLRLRVMAGRLELRYHRKLPSRLRALDFLLYLRWRGFLGAAPAAGRGLTRLINFSL